MADKGFQYHIHQGLFEVLYCLEGDVECKIAGIVYPFPPHTLLIVKPDVPHATYVHSNQAYVRYVMHFSDNAAYTAEAVDLLLTELEENGSEFRFVGLNTAY